MIEALPHPTQTVEEPWLKLSATLFVWHGGQITLLGERTRDQWILARGWPEQDRLADIRRWYFASPKTFAAQVFRLTREATHDIGISERSRTVSFAWAQTAVAYGNE